MARGGPGPGAYMLPPTVGYNKHDPSKHRNPMYSMAGKHAMAMKGVGPGPTYDVENMTRYGKAYVPAYSIVSRKKDLTSFRTPGPGTYSLDKKCCAKNPGFTMASRYHEMLKSQTPGPNQYMTPSCIGSKVPHMPASAAYSISGKHDLKKLDQSPGPAKYGGTPTDVYRYKYPKYTMGGRYAGVRDRSQNPGPAGYFPKMKQKGSGGFSFGTRTANSPYITADDNMPCVNRGVAVEN